MTEPRPVMDEAELIRMTKEVGRAMMRAAGPQWRRVRAEYRSVGRHIEVDYLVTGADDQPRALRPPAEVVDGLARMRAGMYRPGRGTWIGAVYEVEASGEYTCEFEPDLEPAWRRVPPPIGFADELRTFPREDESIPDWFRERAGLPPAVSAEARAARTPPGGIPAQQPEGGSQSPNAPPPGTPAPAQHAPGAPGPGPSTPPPGFPGPGRPAAGQPGPGQHTPPPGFPGPGAARPGPHPPGFPPPTRPGPWPAGPPQAAPPQPGRPVGPPQRGATPPGGFPQSFPRREPPQGG